MHEYPNWLKDSRFIISQSPPNLHPFPTLYMNEYQCFPVNGFKPKFINQRGGESPRGGALKCLLNSASARHVWPRANLNNGSGGCVGRVNVIYITIPVFKSLLVGFPYTICGALKRMTLYYSEILATVSHLHCGGPLPVFIRAGCPMRLL